jgi:hypothetical protein
MLNRQSVGWSIAEYLGYEFVADGDEPIPGGGDFLREGDFFAPYSDDWMDWPEVIGAVDKNTGNMLDPDMELWDELGGNPDWSRPINPYVTFREMIDFICAQPTFTVEHVVRKVIAGQLRFGDPDLVPIGFCIRECGEWMKLLATLNQSLLAHHRIEIDNTEWKDLGRDHTPSLLDVINLAEKAKRTALV